MKILKKLFIVVILLSALSSCSNDDISEPICETCDCNEAYNIQGWTETENFEFQFSENMINATFSASGEYFFVSGNDPVANQSRFTLDNNWDIQSINTIADQIDSELNIVNGSNGTYAVFNKQGNYRYMKNPELNLWVRQPVHTPFDLSTVEEEDEFNYLNTNDFIYMIPSGEKFYGIDKDSIYEYVSDFPEQSGIDAIGSTNVISTSFFLPINKTLQGFQYSEDGMKAFVYATQDGSENNATIYQLDLADSFNLSTVTFNGVSVSFITVFKLNSVQFTSDGKSFITVEGSNTQIIRKFC